MLYWVNRKIIIGGLCCCQKGNSEFAAATFSWKRSQFGLKRVIRDQGISVFPIAGMGFYINLWEPVPSVP
jgi:hypothetical protein